MLALILLADASAQSLPMPAFLAGCWEYRREEYRWTEECWTSARGGLMMGSGRDGKADSVINWEWMRIERAADGTPTFYASVKGVPSVAFRATAADAKSITFVNAAHDYPQRVRYVRTPIGVDAEISLVDGSNARRWSYIRSGNSGGN